MVQRAKGTARIGRSKKATEKSGRPAIRTAKDLVIREITSGATVKEAMVFVGRTPQTYEYWRATDEDFKNQIDFVRKLKKRDAEENREELIGEFEQFREKYLGLKTFLHQSQWIDLIEGRDPRDLHPSMIYEKGSPQYILINTAPEHSKSMTLSIDYVTYRICKDPNVRVIIVSRTEAMAKQFVYAVKHRLTSRSYADLQVAFAPPGGYDGPGAVWQSNLVYISSDARDTGEKDPTINALGIEGHIYGARADLIIVDDGVVLANASHYDKQIRWLQQEVITRLGPGGKLVVAGTRVDAVDLYKELRNPDRYPDGKSPWTYLAQPAVLEFADDPKDWVTLWPRSNVPWLGTEDTAGEDGLYPRWDGPHLAERRKVIDSKTWSMVYQQADVSEDAVFDPADIKKCTNHQRNPGLLQRDNPYHPERGMEDMYVICSMDPAMKGDTATIAYAVDTLSRKRYILEAHRMTSPTPKAIRDIIMAWTRKYNPAKWVVEKNAFQLFLTRDEEIRNFLASNGCAMVEHFTGAKKLDPDFGVASLAPLFSEEMIELPAPSRCEGVKALIEQLISWQPGIAPALLKQDLPMALWFAEIEIRQMLEVSASRSLGRSTSPYVPRYRRAQRTTVFFDQLMGST